MAVLGSAVDSGMTHFDTARMYGLGMAEAELGAFLRTIDRDRVTIGTKFGTPVGGLASRLARFQAPARALLRKAPALRAAVKSRQAPAPIPRAYDATIAACSLDESLTALGVDYVDILFVHGPRHMDTVATDELREFFERARQQGKIRAWGVSQDEDLEVDFVGRFGPEAVDQLRSDVLHPPPRASDITFGVLNRPLEMISSALQADTRMASQWRDALQLDPLAPGVLAKLLLGSATAATESRAILYSTTDPKRIAQAADAVSSPYDAETLSRFLELAAEFRLSGRMVRKTEDFVAGTTIRTDVVVVGAGPIGISTALELAKSGVEVALIESGLERTDHTAQELASFDSRQDDVFHARSDLTVRRAVGGASALWGGRCVAFDPIDFEDRPLTAQAPWPIRHSDVEPYMQRACDWAQCGRAAFNVRDIPELAQRDLVAGLPDGDVRTSDLERWALPTRFGREYRDAMHDSPLLSLWTGLTCTEVVTTERGDSVDHLVVKTLDGKEGKVVANDYVIATGGVEATRLLLASDRHHPAGLGNAGGHLGRWYMAHTEGRFARVKFNTDDVIYEHERDRDGVYVRRRFTFSPQLQRELEIPNAATWLVNPPISDPGHGSGILSGVYLTLISPVGRFLLAEAIREAHTKTEGPPQIMAHVRNIVRDLIPSIRFAITFSYARLIRKGRKAPGFFIKSADNRYLLHYHGEHLPHWESRVELTEERDALGMRKVRTHMHFSDADYESARKAIELIDAHLRATGAGNVEWLTDDPEGSVREFMRGFAGYHQAGTTRMSESAEDGVVDSDLQVHGVRGLYVASTSVLPTSSQANPTLVGIALGVRLADHLADARAAEGS